jgi:hypothetical protein
MSDMQTAPYSSSRTRSSGQHFADLRPSSPAQLAVIGLGIWIAGLVIHSLAILAPLGLGLLLIAGVAHLVRPRSRTMYWRGRQIDLGDEPTAMGRMYRNLFKH